MSKTPNVYHLEPRTSRDRVPSTALCLTQEGISRLPVTEATKADLASRLTSGWDIRCQEQPGQLPAIWALPPKRNQLALRYEPVNGSPLPIVRVAKSNGSWPMVSEQFAAALRQCGQSVLLPTITERLREADRRTGSPGNYVMLVTPNDYQIHSRSG